jgi:hypothetical protein
VLIEALADHFAAVSKQTTATPTTTTTRWSETKTASTTSTTSTLEAQPVGAVDSSSTVALTPSRRKSGRSRKSIGGKDKEGIASTTSTPPTTTSEVPSLFGSDNGGAKDEYYTSIMEEINRRLKEPQAEAAIAIATDHFVTTTSSTNVSTTETRSKTQAKFDAAHAKLNEKKKSVLQHRCMIMTITSICLFD